MKSGDGEMKSIYAKRANLAAKMPDLAEKVDSSAIKRLGLAIINAMVITLLCGLFLLLPEDLTAQSKSKGNTVLPDSIKIFSSDFNYAFSKKSYSNLYGFDSIPGIVRDSVKYPDTPLFLGKIGISYPFTGNADLFFAPKLNKGFSLSAVGSFKVFSGNLPTVAINDRMMLVKSGKKVAADNRALSLGADGGYSWDQGVFATYLKYMSGYYKCYGENVTESSPEKRGSNSMNLFEAGASVRSLYSEEENRKFGYNISASCSWLDNRDLTDNYINLQASGTHKTGANSGITFGTELRLETALKRTGYNREQNNIYDFYAMFGATYGRMRYSIKGILSLQNSSTAHGGKYVSPLFINADISIPLINNILLAYGKIDGGNISNNFVSLIKENKMINRKAAVLNGAIPLSIKGGLKVTLNNKFSFDLYTGYAIHKGLQQFVNLYGSKKNEANGAEFVTAYSNHNRVMFGLSSEWSDSNVEIGIRAEYDLYSRGKSGLINGDKNLSGNLPFGYAPFNALLYFTYKEENSWYISTSIVFRSRSSSGLESLYSGETTGGKPISGEVKIPAYANWKIEGGYSLNDNISLFVSFSNLLNSNIQYYSQYIEKGREIGVGVVVKF